MVVRPLVRSVAVAACLALTLVASFAAYAVDPVKARKKLDDEYIPFTPEKFLHYAFMDDKKMIGLFLDAGMPINTSDDQGTALHRAARQDDGKTLALLVKAGADLNAHSKSGKTPLCEAADDGKVKNVAALIAAGADVNALCSSGRTALHEAAAKNSGPAVAALLKAGAKLEARDEHLDTPLLLALKGETPEALKVLIAAGASVDAKSKNGETGLHVAVNRGSVPMLNALISAGAQVDARDSQGQTPLYLAAAYDRIEVIPPLLAAGADPAAKNNRGQSVVKVGEESRSVRALDLVRGARKVDVAPVPKGAATSSGSGASGTASAPFKGDPKKELQRLGLKYDKETFFNRVEVDDTRAIELFLAAGFDPAGRNEQGRPALYVAVEGSHEASVKALLAGKANPNDPGVSPGKNSDSGETLVMRAVDGVSLPILRALVAAGADVNRGNMYKVTPLMSAAQQGKLEMVEILLQAGANPNATIQGGTNALYSPVREGYVEVVRALLKAGAKVGKNRKLLMDNAKDPGIKKLLKEAV